MNTLFAGLLAWLCIAGSVTAAGGSIDLAPQVVQQMSAAYVRTMPVDRSDKDRSDARSLYQRAFLAAYTSRSPWYGSENAGMDGHAAGKWFLHDNPSRRAEIMSGFGFTHVELAGTWIVGFEVSSFDSAATGSEQWWLSSMPDAHIDVDLGMAGAPRNRAGFSKRVRVEGWLSPRGEYGHMNVYNRELFMSSIAPDVSESTEPSASDSR